MSQTGTFGALRFDDFAAHLSISTKVLANRLQRLSEEGLIKSRADQADRRGKIYELTEKGVALRPIIGALTQWGDTWAPKENGPRTEFYEIATGETITEFAVVSKSGIILGPDEVGHRTGPGGSQVREELDALVEKRKGA